MCRNAKVPSRKKLSDALSYITIESPNFDGIENANSFDHPELPIITSAEPNKIVLASWGLVPEYIKGIDKAMEIANMCRNAKAETIFEKASFSPYIMTKRCLVFVEGFYEWRHEDSKGKKKTPYYVSLKDSEIIPFAGFYTDWYDEQAGKTIKTCTIITTAANDLMKFVHNSKERQPLIMPKDKWDLWLDTSLKEEQIVELMKVYPDGNMQADKIEPERPKSDGDPLSLF